MTSLKLYKSGISGLLDHTAKYSKRINYGICVKATRNNTTVALTKDDKVACTSSGGRFYKKARRSGFEPAFEATTDVINQYFKKTSIKLDGQFIHLKLKGFGPGREASMQALRLLNIKVGKIEDTTPFQFGGCRAPKQRRL
eukprot:NODE_294_length_11497_cov_0.618530.p7 type:complete len:141 gc:universal NODE_294_length_11497_cov_0.618530:583-161(-)